MNKKWQVCRPGDKLGRWSMPQATMDKKGDIMISPFTWELLGSSPFAVVLFDPANQMIGISPQQFETEDTLPILKRVHHRGRRIRATSLRRQVKVPIEKTVAFVKAFIDDEGILNLDLKTARPAYHGRRVGAYHNERKEKLDRLRPPRPNWLGEQSAERDG